MHEEAHVDSTQPSPAASPPAHVPVAISIPPEDESWFVGFLQPVSPFGPIESPTDAQRRLNTYNKRMDVYIRLAKVLSEGRDNIQQLVTDASQVLDSGDSAAARELKLQLLSIWTRRQSFLLRCQEAFENLHAWLSDLKHGLDVWAAESA